VGVNFGTDSADEGMLATYGKLHRREDIVRVVRLCREHGLRVMIDLLLGGPGETEASVRDTIEFMKGVDPDCVGAALGVRVYPGTPLARVVSREGLHGRNANLRWPRGAPEGDEELRDVAGLLLRPVFYLSSRLGESPAEFVRDAIGGDKRFFEPVCEQGEENYNYSQNVVLTQAIENGARGAYWDILRNLRGAST